MSRPKSEGWETERHYDRWAGVYDVIFDPFCLPGRRRAIEVMDCRPGDRVLEIGAGTGTSLPLYPAGTEVVGTDLSQGMLQKAADLLNERDVPADWSLARMDAGHLGFQDASFDKVAAFYVVSVLPDPALAIEEMERVCRPGGDLILVNHFHSTHPLIGRLERALEPLTRRLGWRTSLRLDELVQETGLNVEAIEPVNLMGYWRLVHARREEGLRVETAEIA